MPEPPITCPFPQRVDIGLNPRQVVWVCPGCTVSITGLPGEYFENCGPFGAGGRNYRCFYNGEAPPNTVWPYQFSITCDDGSKFRMEEEPELTNGPG